MTQERSSEPPTVDMARHGEKPAKSNLIACVDCGAMVSRHASACPACGRPVPPQLGARGVIRIACAAVMLLMALMVGIDKMWGSGNLWEFCLPTGLIAFGGLCAASVTRIA